MGGSTPRYDGLADEYDAFVDIESPYYAIAARGLRKYLGEGSGRCLDVGCGGGHFIPLAVELGWFVTGVDLSEDQLRIARTRVPNVELVRTDASALPFADNYFDTAYSTFTHTDLDEFAAAMDEAKRVLKPGGRFVYIGNHPCFVGATQEHKAHDLPRLHPGYRRAGRWAAGEAPGATPGGWRERLGSFVHVPLAEFLTAFAGFVIEIVDELEDGREYPATIALALSKP
jgi:SAM-dependent methyltransferase